MSWGSTVKTVYITLSNTPQSIRSLMPIYCQCGRMVIEWMFAPYSDPGACPFCGGSISDAKEMEPITGFYHKVPQVKEVVVDEVSGVQQQKTKRQFAQLLCNWEDEGRGQCHSDICNYQDPLWNILAERDKWKEDKTANTKYPVHFPVAPQHVMLVYSYDKKGPAIFRFGNLMKADLEKIYQSKGRLSGRDITIYKTTENNQTKHVATPGDPSALNIARDSFDQATLEEMIKAMREREEPPNKELMLPYLRGEIVSLNRQKIETAKVALPGSKPLGQIGPIPIDPSKPMVGVTPTQPRFPSGTPLVDAGSTSDASGMIVSFGKYKSKRLGEIMLTDPSYVSWISKNMMKDHPSLASAATILVGFTPVQPAQSPAQPQPQNITPQYEPEPEYEPEPLPDDEKTTAQADDDLFSACNDILNNDPKWKDNATLKSLLDKFGEGLEAFEKYQIAKWGKDRLAKLYEEIKR